MLNVSLLQFYFLNYDESLFYILIKVIIKHLTQKKCKEQILN